MNAYVHISYTFNNALVLCTGRMHSKKSDIFSNLCLFDYCAAGRLSYYPTVASWVVLPPAPKYACFGGGDGVRFRLIFLHH